MAVVYNTTIDQGADWYVDFIYNQPAEITNITANGTTVTFTATNGFTVGQIVSITGVLPSQYNFQNVAIASASAENFTVTNSATGVYISGGLAYAPVNLTSYTAKLQIRSYPDSDPVLTLTSSAGITITALTGNVQVHATATQTRAIDEGTYIYDIEITSVSGIVTRLAQGQVVVSPEVTQ